ncbi:hypothetical protein HanXRQr2_Chr15g0706701 [Helianthus annuus]|uniref:Uncharacterized protein n=1 Tax=Helianthus annuus TaxID=4232 RepID=A0A9K3E274_HELAN|nr:hypothetical protein HanXRQr2_Chr15g0706701 [Helianthus annuus]KAJ0832394.1 hypothetical protein HanPSC8_Chr15g0678301 [Helianthus annuus]
MPIILNDNFTLGCKHISKCIIQNKIKLQNLKNINKEKSIFMQIRIDEVHIQQKTSFLLPKHTFCKNTYFHNLC